MAEINSKDNNQQDYIKFLGTAGARFVMIKQLRASGGIWVSKGGANVLIDPGPGSIVRCALSKPRLDPGKLDGIILTHGHLDHSGDINVMIEAMTEGGFKKRGIVLCPEDAMKKDKVILKYASRLPEKIGFLRARKKYSIDNFDFTVSMQHVHPAETYGLKFRMKDNSISLLTDTKYFKGLKNFYKTDILIVSVVFVEPKKGVDHLSLKDVEILGRECKPKRMILTHFGMSMLRSKPHIQAQALSQKLGLLVTAAYDGMTLKF